MTIEAGVLAIRISEEGADQVSQKLDALDTKAKKLGATPVKMSITGASSTELSLIDRQLTQMGQQITLYKQGAQFATTKAASLKELGSIEQQLRGIVAGSNTTLEQRIGAEKQLAQIMGGAPARVGAATSAWSSFGKTLAAIGIVITLDKIIGSMASIVTNAINAGDALHDLSIQTGISTETLSVLQQVGEKSGASGAVLEAGMRRLARSVQNLREGNKEAAADFAALGLSVQDLEGLSLDQIFLKIADAQSTLAEGTGKTDLMMNLLGRSGDKLLPLMQDLAGNGFDLAREKAERFGTVIGPEFANQADHFNDSMADMHSAILGVGIAIAENMLPGMDRLAERMTNIIAKGRPFIATFLAAAASMFVGGPAGLHAGKADEFTKQLEKAAMIALPGAVVTGPKGKEVVRDPAAERRAEEARRNIEKALAINIGNIPLRDRATALEGASLGQAGPQLVGVDKSGKMQGLPEAILPVRQTDQELGVLLTKLEARKEQLKSIMTDIALAIGSAFGDAFTAAFSGEDNFFAAFGKALLASVGSILMSIGATMIAYGAIVTPLLGVPGPFQALGLGAAASAAAGIGLIALGAGLGALAGGGSKGGAGGGGKASPKEEPNEFSVAFDPDRKLRRATGSVVSPSARGLGTGPMPDARPTVVIGTINSLSPDDAKWQRAVADTYTNARNRGLVRSG